MRNLTGWLVPSCGPARGIRFFPHAPVEFFLGRFKGFKTPGSFIKNLAAGAALLTDSEFGHVLFDPDIVEGPPGAAVGNEVCANDRYRLEKTQLDHWASYLDGGHRQCL